MKKIFGFFISLAACFALTSCAKWLTEDTRADNVTDSYYKDLTALESGLTGVYAGFKGIYNVTGMGLTMLGTDEIYTITQSTNMASMDQYAFSASSTVIENWYYAHFDIIQRANIIISRAPGVPDISEADLARVLGEARFLRAWSYFRMVQVFGRLPLVLEESKEINYKITREPIADIYKTIIEDLEFASKENVLGTKKDGGKVNQWAAKALLARVYLTLATSIERNPQPIEEYSTMGDDYVPVDLYGKCLSLCDDIIANGNFSLVKNYRDMFLIENKNTNSESIWEIQFSSTPGYGSAWSKQFGVYGFGTTNLYTQNAVIGTTAYKAVPSFWRYFRLGDSRRDWSIADWSVVYSTVSGETKITKQMLTAQGIDGDSRNVNLDTDDEEWLKASLESNMVANRLTVSKYRWGTEGDPDQWYLQGLSFAQDNCPNNVISLRYADVLLMRAESDILLNGTASEKSLSLINQLTARARGVNPNTQNWFTEDEMKSMVMKPYEDEIAEIQEQLAEIGGSDEALQAELDKAILARDKASARLLMDYTASTLTYDELLTQRACELCFEFHRWFDLVRTGKLIEAVSGRITCPSLAPKVKIQNKNYLMPIPQRELDLASDKTLFPQNPEY